MLKKKYEYFVRNNVTYSNCQIFTISCEENATVRQTILIIFDFAMACKLLRRRQETYIWSRFLSTFTTCEAPFNNALLFYLCLQKNMGIK